jgi:hypothetical protein
MLDVLSQLMAGKYLAALLAFKISDRPVRSYLGKPRLPSQVAKNTVASPVAIPHRINTSR